MAFTTYQRSASNRAVKETTNVSISWLSLLVDFIVMSVLAVIGTLLINFVLRKLASRSKAPSRGRPPAKA
jgi:hypothetical protein